MDIAATVAAVRTWVMAGTGLPTGSVIIADQDGPRPAKPYATVKLASIAALGAYDESKHEYDAGADPGEEITITTGGHRELVVSVNVYTPASTGSAGALAFAMKLRSAASSETTTTAMQAAGASLFDVGQVRDLSAIDRTKFEGRAQLDARLYTTDSTSETTTFIESVTVNDGQPGEFTEPEA